MRQIDGETIAQAHMPHIAVRAMLFSSGERFSPVLKAGVIHNDRNLFGPRRVMIRHE
jgi:hypothetical protein